MEERIILKEATITFRTDGIIHIHYNDGLLSLEENKYIFNVTREKSPWDVAPVFLSGSDFANQDKESRDFNGSKIVTDHCSAIAMLSNTLGQKLMANFFIKVIKPAVPTRFFSDQNEAIAWLLQFKTTQK